MESCLYRYEFEPHVRLETLESALLLTFWAAESLHGEIQVQLDFAYYLDAESRLCVIDASTDVGVDACRLFLGFLKREFGPDCFRVERLNQPARSWPLKRGSRDAEVSAGMQA